MQPLPNNKTNSNTNNNGLSSPSGSFRDNDSELLDLLSSLDSFNPIIPDALLDYHFTRAGLQCDDARLKKLVSLVAQKFITDITSDAVAHQRLRINRSASSSSSSSSTSASSGPSGKKNALSLEDLTAALAERGIDIKRPFYHI